jgi:WD40 repeat protein
MKPMQESPEEKNSTPVRPAVDDLLFVDWLRSEWSRISFGDDIFVSYSHKDPTYAAGLANALAERRFSCKFDQWGTEPGKKIPTSLRTALLGSSALVLLCTEGSISSEPVNEEVREFSKTKRPIIPIHINGDIGSALYADVIEGLPKTTESPEALRTGTPAEEVVNRIEKTCLFTRKDQRLHRAAVSAATVVVIFTIAAGIAAMIARSATHRAQTETAIAVAAEDRAVTATREEERASIRARRSSLIADATDSLTAGQPLPASLAAKQALELDLEHPQAAASKTPALVLARAINQGIPREYPYFANVLNVKLNSSGTYLAAIGKIAGQDGDSTALKVWPVDGGHQQTLLGDFSGLTFSKRQNAIVVGNVVGVQTARGKIYHFEVQWYSYDLRLLKAVRLSPLPSKSPAAAESAQSAPEMEQYTRLQMLRDSKGHALPAFYVNDIQDLRFSTDGRILAIAGLATDAPWIDNPHHYRAWIEETSARVTATVDEDHELTSFYENRERVRFLGSLPYLISDGTREIFLHNLQTHERKKIGEHSSDITDLAASRSGTKIAAVGQDNKITVLSKAGEVWTSKLIALPGEEHSVMLAFLDENHVAVARDDFSVTLIYTGDEANFNKHPLDTDAGLLWEDRPSSTLHNHSGEIEALEVGGDGKWLATGGEDKKVIAVNLQFQDKRELQGNTRQIRCLAFDERGTTLVSGGVDGVIRVWLLDGAGPRSVATDPALAHSEPFVSREQWDEGGDLSRRMVREHLGFVEQVRASPDGRWLAASTYNGVRTLFSADLTLIKSWKDAYGGDEFFFSGDSEWIVSTRNDATRGTGEVLSRRGFDLTNVRTDQVIHVNSKVSISEGMFSRGGLWATKGANQTLILHRIKDGVDGTILPGTFSPDGNWYALKSDTGGDEMRGRHHPDRELLLWKTSEPQTLPVRVILSGTPVNQGDDEMSGEQVVSFDQWMSFSPGSHFLAICVHTPNGKAIELISIPDLHHTVLRGDKIHGPFAISPNDSWLAGQGEAAAGLVWASSGGAPRALIGHSLAVNSQAFSPDSAFLATASDDRTVRIWDLTTLANYQLNQTNPPAGLAFVADGTALVVGSGVSLHRWFSPSGSSAKTLKDADRIIGH